MIKSILAIDNGKMSKDRKQFRTQLNIVTDRMLRLYMQIPEHENEMVQDVVDSAIRKFIEEEVKQYYTSETLKNLGIDLEEEGRSQ